MRSINRYHGALVGLSLLLAVPAQAATPAAFGKAEQLLPLADGGWLLREKKQLVRLDAQGKQTASLAIKASQLDARGERAVVVDYDSQRITLIDLAGKDMRISTVLPDTGFAIEALCLYRDPQGLQHAFAIGEEGHGVQWLLDGPAPRTVRTLALPPGITQCAVDEATGKLLVAEEDFGVWAYPADAERKFAREAVLLRQPLGPLQGGALALAVQAQRIAVLEEDGKRVFLSERSKQRWQLLDTRSSRVERDALAWAGRQLAWRDAASGRWDWHAKRTPTVGAAEKPLVPVVLPTVQTDPVAKRGDAADDPAIWVHPSQPELSRVLGTNKKQGLLVYDLQGRERQLLAVGRVNNVDLRQGVMLDGERRDLAVATQRDEAGLVLFDIGPDGTVRETGRVPTGLNDVYGLCVYVPKQGGLDVFVNDKDGRFEQIRLSLQAGSYRGELLRRFALASQPEGCVADERTRYLFLGEEKHGLWGIPAEADQTSKPTLILPVGKQLAADVEGMGLYHGAKRSYLVVSSQGEDRYEVLDATPPFRHRGTFRVGLNVAAGIDAASETDGLEVTSANLGTGFERGMLVVQDGHKRLPDGPQNFKYVSWAAIADALKLD